MDMQHLWEYIYWMSVQDATAIKMRRKFVLSGCLQGEIYQLFVYLFRNPKTSIVLTTRDYADRAYSVYKYFCSATIDNDCSTSRHTIKGIHERSPSQFHNIITLLKNNDLDQDNIHHIIYDDWKTRSSFYRLKADMYASNSSNAVTPNILMVAMESIDSNPKSFWFKVTKDFLKLGPKQHFAFSSVKKLSKIHVNEGNISTDMPMRWDTRQLLNRAWGDDCLWTSRATGFIYPACNPTAIE